MTVVSDGERLRAENETLRARLSSLTDAILRISEDLDLDTVLQEVTDGAGSLTEARYTALTTYDESGDIRDLLISGLGAEQTEQMLGYSMGPAVLAYLRELREPLRTRDFVAHADAAGFPDFPVKIGAFLSAQIRVRDRLVGNIYIGEKVTGGEFTRDDEETLRMFASQAALAITNAHRYGEEQQTKADLEALVNTSPVGVLVLDAATRDVVKINDEACRLIGIGSGDDEDLARALDEVEFRRLDGAVVSPDEVPHERSARTGETVRAEELVLGSPSGDRVTTLINSTPIRSEGDQLATVVVTIQDITPLEELERLRTDFLGMVSHELRTPLTSIKGSAATVLGARSPLDPAETRQFFRIIEEQADHMRDLINNLLDLTRIEAGTLSVVAEPTDVAALIEQARNAFLSGGYRNNIEIDVAPNLPRVAADGQRIIQVLHNLFSNASKYSRDWSPIRVTSRREDTHVVTSVADEGRGIAGEDLPHLFTKFSRIEAGGEHRVGGHGLGLAICRGIVEAHGGRIWAESDGDGKGTRFIFTIPAVNGAIPDRSYDSADGPTESEDGRRARERILVVDDDPQILRYVRNTLSEAGYRPVVTGDVDEVSSLLESERPQLVLVNLVLPGIDGFELLRRIRTDSHVPVIVLSGRGGGQDIAKAFELGVADYVVKPFSPAELVARIGATLRQAAAYPHGGLEPYTCGDLVINHLERSVTVAGKPVRLTPTEYKLLFELSRFPGRVLTHDQLLNSVWSEDRPADQRLLRSFVKNVRQKLGDDARNPSYIFTQSGVGYRLSKA
ncbi:ATP-binding protein [Candidatus Spongiisocius sp.]|uniref:hybrid sensor histidine kinase/response regulator n=1 Tax=Candidatus Spongiisocius sp. TaxID=3101273 RepID=UPI003B5CC88E